MKRHFVPYFSKRCPLLEDITPRIVKDYMNYIKVGGRCDGKDGGLSNASVRKHLSILKQAFNEAVTSEYIASNPAAFVKNRRSARSYSTKAVMMTADEAQRLIDAFKGHVLYPAVVIALYYGLRRSEVLGLRWSAIDFLNNEIRIEHTVVNSLTIEAKDTTKTESSNAVFSMLPEIKTMLLEMKSVAPKNSEYIFSWSDGRVFRPDYVTRAFSKHLKKCGLPHMRFHDLRHSTASILFDKGMSLEDVKNWLRHSDIETTSNIYLHYGRARKKIVSDAVEGLFKI